MPSRRSPNAARRLIDADKLECVLFEERTRLANISHLNKDFSSMLQAFGMSKARSLSILQPTIIEAESAPEDTEERNRRLARENYYAQLSGLGYNPDGTPKEE